MDELFDSLIASSPAKSTATKPVTVSSSEDTPVKANPPKRGKRRGSTSVSVNQRRTWDSLKIFCSVLAAPKKKTENGGAASRGTKRAKKVVSDSGSDSEEIFETKVN